MVTPTVAALTRALISLPGLGAWRHSASAHGRTKALASATQREKR
jgi:hypothetical protein